MADIDPTQDYDVIHTLTFAAGSGTCAIRLYRGSSSEYSGTVYYRAGISGEWTPLAVSGTSTTFPVSSTTMQIGHDHNKSGNDYMTASFYGQSTNLVGIAISQKAAFSGGVGNYFMYYFARGCSALTSLDFPDISGVTSVGDSFLLGYARYCIALTLLDVPDTGEIVTVGSFFLSRYAQGCSLITSLAIPDTSKLSSVSDSFMILFATGCDSILRLELPSAGWFVGHDITLAVPSGRLGLLKGYVTNPADLAAWQALTASGKTLYLNYIQNANDVILEGSTGGAGRLIGSGDPSMIHVAHPKMIHVANPSLIRARGG